MQKILIRHTSDITVDWAQRIVNGNYTDITVSDVKVLSVEIGTTTRVRVEVTHNGPADSPKRWFVKLPSISLRARLITALPRLLQTEVRFYREVSSAVPLIQPVILAAQKTPGWNTTLVLADITENGSLPGSPGDELTVDQAFLVIEQLANLHARFWNARSLYNEYKWLSGPVRRLENILGTALAVPLMKRGLKCAGSSIPATLHIPALNYAHNRRRMMRFLARGSHTIVHHDCHPGNIFWKHDQPGFLDWQLVRVGEGIGDVAYFLATALNPDSRKKHETNILQKYLNVLSTHGIREYDLTQLRERYRAHLCYPFEAMVITLAIGGMMERESNLELIRRTVAAVKDLNAFAIKPD